MGESLFDQSLVTGSSLRIQLEGLGLEPGSLLMVHSSLSAPGFVLGGAPTVVGALVDVLGEEGTLAMPAATPYCADPAGWPGPRVPESRLEELRRHLPPFDVRTTPTSMGAIPETFRTWPGTLRSDHPVESVCARGPRAAEITASHPRAFSEGPGTPFGRLHDLGATVLLLGVGFNRCTALHLAETLAAKRRTTTVRFPVLEEGRRVWVEVPNVADDDDTHFPRIGRAYLATGRARQGRVGRADAAFFPMQDLVRFAVDYFAEML